jgi:two-component system, chemotaxis family, response regulator Rcp1
MIRILLVEDSQADVRLTREALAEVEEASELHVAPDGDAALDFLRRDGPRPDLVLLDLNLPGKDGRELLAELRADPDLHTIPVVVLTTSGAPDDIQRTYDLAAASYVTKPVEASELRRVFRSIGSASTR